LSIVLKRGKINKQKEKGGRGEKKRNEDPSKQAGGKKRKTPPLKVHDIKKKKNLQRLKHQSYAGRGKAIPKRGEIRNREEAGWGTPSDISKGI